MACKSSIIKIPYICVFHSATITLTSEFLQKHSNSIILDQVSPTKKQEAHTQLFSIQIGGYVSFSHVL